MFVCIQIIKKYIGMYNVCSPAIMAPHQGKPQETCINSKAFCNNPTGVKEPSPALWSVCSPNAFCTDTKIEIIIITVPFLYDY